MCFLLFPDRILSAQQHHGLSAVLRHLLQVSDVPLKPGFERPAQWQSSTFTQQQTFGALLWLIKISGLVFFLIYFIFLPKTKWSHFCYENECVYKKGGILYLKQTKQNKKQTTPESEAVCCPQHECVYVCCGSFRKYVSSAHVCLRPAPWCHWPSGHHRRMMSTVGDNVSFCLETSTLPLCLSVSHCSCLWADHCCSAAEKAGFFLTFGAFLADIM